jgi:hypothetical protein
MRLLLLLLLAGCEPGVEPGDWYLVGGDELPPPGVEQGEHDAIEALWTGSADVVPGQSFGGEGQVSLRDLTTDEETCRIVFEVEQHSVNDSCGDCLWAFDVERVHAMGEVFEGCGGDHEPEAVDGTTFALGFNADVLWMDEGEGWYRAGSGWFEGDGRFYWEREQGFSDDE